MNASGPKNDDLLKSLKSIFPSFPLWKWEFRVSRENGNPGLIYWFPACAGKTAFYEFTKMGGGLLIIDN
jgi:hypothetical protein